jgi:hypothetical protein
VKAADFTGWCFCVFRLSKAGLSIWKPSLNSIYWTQAHVERQPAFKPDHAHHHAQPRSKMHRVTDSQFQRNEGAIAIVYLRAAQVYMLISMPTGTSTIFGVFQAISDPSRTKRRFAALDNDRTPIETVQADIVAPTFRNEESLT